MWVDHSWLVSWDRVTIHVRKQHVLCACTRHLLPVLLCKVFMRCGLISGLVPRLPIPECKHWSYADGKSLREWDYSGPFQWHYAHMRKDPRLSVYSYLCSRAGKPGNEATWRTSVQCSAGKETQLVTSKRLRRSFHQASQGSTVLLPCDRDFH